jgi:hypothetical protein
LSEVYSLWTDCREDTAFGIVDCLAITRKRLPQAYGMHVTKQRLLHGVHVTIYLISENIGPVLFSLKLMVHT